MSAERLQEPERCHFYKPGRDKVYRDEEGSFTRGNVINPSSITDPQTS